MQPKLLFGCLHLYIHSLYSVQLNVPGTNKLICTRLRNDEWGRSRTLHHLVSQSPRWLRPISGIRPYLFVLPSPPFVTHWKSISLPARMQFSPQNHPTLHPQPNWGFLNPLLVTSQSRQDSIIHRRCGFCVRTNVTRCQQEMFSFTFKIMVKCKRENPSMQMLKFKLQVNWFSWYFHINKFIQCNFPLFSKYLYNTVSSKPQAFFSAGDT